MTVILAIALEYAYKYFSTSSIAILEAISGITL